MNYHEHTGHGFRCPKTGLLAPWTWTDRSRPGAGNSCEHCSAKPAKNVVEMLHKLNRKRRRS